MTSASIDIIDDFVPSEEFKTIKNVMMGNTFPWYWNPNITYEDSIERNGQFSHTFFRENEGKSDWYSLMRPIIRDLYYPNQGVLYRLKANLNPREDDHYQLGEYHSDYNLTCKTAILYINTNNGYTKFEGVDDSVESVENRMVIFDSHIKHVGFTCTDEKTRVLLNINYVTYQ